MMPDKYKTILLADYPLIRKGLRLILEKERGFNITGETGDGEEAVRLAGELAPDIAIVGIKLPSIDGISVTRRIKSLNKSIAVIVLSMYDDGDRILRAIEAGASGYISKMQEPGDDIAHVIRCVAAGNIVLSASISDKLFHNPSLAFTGPRPTGTGLKLSSREQEILKLLCLGLSNKDLAGKLNLSVCTVKSYLSEIYGKLGSTGRTNAMVIALRHGLVSFNSSDNQPVSGLDGDER